MEQGAPRSQKEEVESNYMTYNTEGMLAVVAALVVLFSSMWDPQVSMIISVAALLLFALNEFRKK